MKITENSEKISMHFHTYWKITKKKRERFLLEKLENIFGSDLVLTVWWVLLNNFFMNIQHLISYICDNVILMFMQLPKYSLFHINYFLKTTMSNFMYTCSLLIHMPVNLLDPLLFTSHHLPSCPDHVWHKLELLHSTILLHLHYSPFFVTYTIR